MVLAQVEDLDPFHLFLWDPIWLEGTPFEINRVVLLMFLASFVCVAFFWAGGRRGALVPKGLQNLAESAYFFVRDQIAIDVIGPKDGLRFAPYLATIFFFIFFMNLLEIVPGINFPVTSRMAIPSALAVLTWIIFNVVGIARHGGHYFKDALFPPGVPWPVYIILTPIELFSTFFIRPLTLAIRLLANMMAGHVLLTIFFLFTNGFLLKDFNIFTAPLGILTMLLGAVLIVFEMLVITIQAYIFTMLTASYIAESIHGHGEAHEVEHEAAHVTEGIPETA